ncbi:MAG: DUF4384 domain-containing protein [Ruegeria sp.]|uniref:DUF4384 domain-containing protein n=1 Tax=Ruegeria sp. TaxID=1879320 RepID=UPI00349EEE16
MSRAPLIWGVGLASSVAAHTGLAAVLLWAVEPQPVTEQPVPETQMQLSAYQVERSQAAEAEPQSEATQSADASGARLDQGAIPQSQAQPLTPAVQAMAAVPETGAELAAANPAGERTEQAELNAVNLAPAKQPAAVLAAVEQRPEPANAAPLSAVSLVAAEQPADRLAAVEQRPQLAVAAQVTAVSLTVAAPVAAAVDTTAAAERANRIDPAPPPADAIAPAQAQPVALTTAEPEVTRAKAALAFDTGDGPIDPVSLAAFQSFMAPEDAGQAAAELRDGIEGLLDQVPCSRLQVQFRPEDNTLELVGHIPETGLRAPVLAALQAQMGANITVADNLLVLPRPQCGALSGIAGVGLPQSTDQITNPLLLGEDVHAREFRYTRGQQLILDLTAPDYDAYVYVDYFDADGQVIHLSPNDSVALDLTPAKSALKVGAEQPGDPGLYITIGPPYGQEIAVAFAASEPLYDGLRPLIEPAAPYLEYLTAQVTAARAANPDFKGEWVYFFVSTAAR